VYGYLHQEFVRLSLKMRVSMIHYGTISDPQILITGITVIMYYASCGEHVFAGEGGGEDRSSMRSKLRSSS
jgi:hypothetical protein